MPDLDRLPTIPGRAGPDRSPARPAATPAPRTHVPDGPGGATHRPPAVTGGRTSRAPISVSGATHGPAARAAHRLRMDTVTVETRPDTTMDPAAPPAATVPSAMAHVTRTMPGGAAADFAAAAKRDGGR